MPRLLHHISARYRRSNVGFAFCGFENAAIKKVTVLIFGIFCTRVFAKDPFHHPCPASSLRSSRAALENAYAFPQLRTLAGSNPSALGTKTKGPHFWEPINSVVGDEGFEPPALCV